MDDDDDDNVQVDNSMSTIHLRVDSVCVTVFVGSGIGQNLDQRWSAN